MKRFAFIALHADHWPVHQQCQLLGVSASGYYAWRKRPATAAVEQAPAAWQVAAQRVFTTHAGRYGQRRLRAQLRREGYAAGSVLVAYVPAAPGLVRGHHARPRPTRRPWLRPTS